MRWSTGGLRIPKGMTLIEVLVTMGVLGILIGLLVPAVQSARESARRLGCASNLRQLGLAIHQYAGVWETLPPTRLDRERPHRFFGISYNFSAQSRLLPYLELSPLYDSINFLIPGQQTSPSIENRTAGSTSVAGFLCPSEPREKAGANSYRVSLGPTPDDLLRVPGAFSVRGTDPLSCITDGLSHTIAMSEKPVGSSKGSRFDSWSDSVALLRFSLFRDEGAWIRACRSIDPRTTRPELLHQQVGATWLSSSGIFTSFQVVLPPNSHIPDCSIFGFAPSGLYTARSRHPGGVNTLMADGAVRWAPSTIHRNVWQALGSRSGAEIATLE